MDYHEIAITVPADQTDAAADIANMAVPYGIYVEDYRMLEEQVQEIAHIDLIDEALLAKDRSKSIIHLYLAQEDNPAESVAFLSERYRAAGIPFEVTVGVCLEKDWANNWKQYFHPIAVGEKLLIQPVWDSTEQTQGRTSLFLEPGIAFGTGAHETTRLCLELIERYLPAGGRVLDVGCGSGILSVAALLLGASQAVGVDIDDAAVRTARENARRNGVEGQFTGLCGSLTERVSGRYELVAANIVADVILDLNQGIVDYLVPGGMYLMSGIIDLREQEVLDSLKDRFEVIEIRRDRGWSAIAARPV